MDDGDLIADLAQDGFGHWLSGFIDGEGSFNIFRHRQGWRSVMRVKLRDDDAAILYECQRRTGLGKVYPQSVYVQGVDVGKRRPQMVWSVYTKADTAKLALVLRCFPLRAKKRADFEVWRLAVAEWNARRRFSHWETMEALHQQLTAVRTYDAPEAIDEAKVAPVVSLQPRLEGL